MRGVITVPSVGPPGYADARVVGTTTFSMAKILDDPGPDVAHLAALVQDGLQGGIGRIFTDPKSGEDLTISLTSFDVIVHTGELETFGQTIQEAQAPASRWSRLDVVVGTAITHPTSITGWFRDAVVG